MAFILSSLRPSLTKMNLYYQPQIPKYKHVESKGRSVFVGTITACLEGLGKTAKHSGVIYRNDN
jgi:hypothetical protein